VQAHAIDVRTASADYQVLVGRGVLRHVGERMQAAGVRAARAAIVCDDAVAAGPGAAVGASLAAAGVEALRLPLHAAEDHKTLATVERLCTGMLDAGLDRGSAVVAVGGGIVGDVVGFAAATYMRGIACVQVPTTLLAMVDAAVGGKTAVNLVRADGTLVKNMVGSFAQPRLVVCDPEVLGTLPARELRSGLAECVKHALIADPSMLAWIEANADPLHAADPGALGELVARNVRIKAAIVGDDEREEGRRALLNLGHTFAHAIEARMHDAVTHGEAVGIGLVAACALGEAMGATDPALRQRMVAVLQRVGLPVRLPRPAPAAELLAAMASDKKKRDGALRFVVPHAAGDVRVVAGVAPALVERAWAAVGG
jgi:3-dehydroquinate synthase